LGGGLPRNSTVLLAGPSGTGKTILSFQWLFQGVREGENGLYLALTEPLFKSVKDLETLKFYDRSAVENEKLKIIDLREGAFEKECQTKEHCLDTAKVISVIEREVRKCNAKRLCIDSITGLAYEMHDKHAIRSFIFDLGTSLAALGCTSVLVSEVREPGKYSIFGVEEFIADTILSVNLKKERNISQREIQLVKVRGRKHSNEEHFFKITGDGIIVYPKLPIKLDFPASVDRVSTGIPQLDEMLHGGLFKGSTTLVSAATGSGKTVLCLHFLWDGLQNNEPCLYAGFEESRDQIIRNAKTFGWDLEKYEKSGMLTLRCVHPDEKLADEHMLDIAQAMDAKKIKRCVVDSLSSISIGLSSDEFSIFSRRLNSCFKSNGATSILTVTTNTLTGMSVLSDAQISTSTDNIMSFRFVELEGTLGTVLNIVKSRGTGHSKDLRKYEIGERGIFIGEAMAGYEGVTIGTTRKVSETIEDRLEAEFKAFIGPMGASAFSEIKAKGLTKTRVTNYIDDLARQGVLKKEDAERFKTRANEILQANGH
jgi:circadian clock protein KaiC